jgi:hypothetical protein
MYAMYDFSDVEPQQSTDLIPDGTFAKVVMTIRSGGVDGQTEIDRGLPPQVLARVHGLRRQARREGRLDRLEHPEAHLPRDDRQRARPGSGRQQR